jgi:hypothetical protein
MKSLWSLLQFFFWFFISKLYLFHNLKKNYCSIFAFLYEVKFMQNFNSQFVLSLLCFFKHYSDHFVTTKVCFFFFLFSFFCKLKILLGEFNIESN